MSGRCVLTDVQLTAHTASSEAVPRPSRAAPPPPRQAWPAPRPRHGPARTLAGPCARGAGERSSGQASFPRRNCFVTHTCGRVAFSRRAVFSVSARGQFSYCIRPRSPLLIRCTRRTSTPAPRVRHTYPSAASLASTACPNARAHSPDRDVGGARGVYLSRPGLLGGRGAASLGAQLLRASADEPLGSGGTRAFISRELPAACQDAPRVTLSSSLHALVGAGTRSRFDFSLCDISFYFMFSIFLFCLCGFLLFLPWPPVPGHRPDPPPPGHEGSRLGPVLLGAETHVHQGDPGTSGPNGVLLGGRALP